VQKVRWQKRTRFWDKLASMAQTLKVTLLEFLGWNYINNLLKIPIPKLQPMVFLSKCQEGKKKSNHQFFQK
jgi:hypothetical protein